MSIKNAVLELFSERGVPLTLTEDVLAYSVLLRVRLFVCDLRPGSGKVKGFVVGVLVTG